LKIYTRNRRQKFYQFPSVLCKPSEGERRTERKNHFNY